LGVRKGEQLKMVKYKTFPSPTFLGLVLNPPKKKERIRLAVARFIKDEVGQDNVISITESRTIFGAFSVTVWYKDKDEPLRNLQLTEEEKQALEKNIQHERLE